MNSLTNEAERSVAVSEVAGLDEGGPLFAQVAERLAGEIADLALRFNRSEASLVVPADYLEVVIER